MLKENLDRAPLRVLGRDGNPTGDAAGPGRDLVPSVSPVRRDPPAEDRQSDDTAAPENESDAKAPARPRRGVKRLVIGVIAVAALVGGGFYGQHWFTVGRYIVSTDNAYVSADNTTLASKISGYITNVKVGDNTFVHAGDVIARIDDGDYQLAVRAARDQIAAQQASIARLGQETAPLRAQVSQAKAQVHAAEAARTRTQLELDRQQALAKRDFASGQKVEVTRAERDQAVAELENAKATVIAAEANIGVLEGKRQEAERTLDTLKTNLAKAERDLSFTFVRAPIDGVIGNRAMQVGDYVTPGARLASIVPLDRAFIDANFKETQIARLKPGQVVDIRIDALPDRTFEGRIESLAPASGSVFSLLPPDNATGNFTKIVQRLPVRISVAPDVLAEHVLRPGMSVIVGVNTKQPTETANTEAVARLAALPGTPER